MLGVLRQPASRQRSEQMMVLPKRCCSASVRLLPLLPARPLPTPGPLRPPVPRRPGRASPAGGEEPGWGRRAKRLEEEGRRCPRRCCRFAPSSPRALQPLLAGRGRGLARRNGIGTNGQGRGREDVKVSWPDLPCSGHGTSAQVQGAV